MGHIFPSTAPTRRVRLSPQPDYYLTAAVVGPVAGVFEDPGSVYLAIGEGALLIGKERWTGRRKLAIGFWRYTKLQDDFREMNPDGIDQPSLLIINWKRHEVASRAP